MHAGRREQGVRECVLRPEETRSKELAHQGREGKEEQFFSWQEYLTSSPSGRNDILFLSRSRRGEVLLIACSMATDGQQEPDQSPAGGLTRGLRRRLRDHSSGSRDRIAEKKDIQQQQEIRILREYPSA